MGTDQGGPGRYVLGHAEMEVDRLATQARIVDPITRRFWVTAGVRPGMSVLDVGCGAGHTTLLLADLVGTQGSVVGVDRAADAVATARARSRGVPQVTYVHANPAGHHFDTSFDAAVGRYVLMYQPEPAEFVSALARHLRPGGILSFHELDFRGVASQPPVHRYDQAARWSVETTRGYGADPWCGSRLSAIFLGAGLPAPTVQIDTVHGRGVEALDVLTRMRNLTRGLLGEMERLGIATADEVGVDTLLDRMTAEAIASDSIVIGPLEVNASCSV